MYHPEREKFIQLAAPGALVPVYKEIVADLETPVSAYMKLAQGQQYTFLLESVEQAAFIGRYSFIGANPSVIFRAKGNEVTITRDGATDTRHAEKPLDELRALMAQYKPAEVADLPEFHGGAVGYMAYDEVRFFEKLPDKNPDTLGLPDLYFMITDTLVIFDHVKSRIKIVSNVHITGDAAAAYEAGCRKIDAIEATLRGPLPSSEKSPFEGGVRGMSREDEESAKEPQNTVIESNFTRESFCAAVEAAKEYIRAGDIFQVVLSQRFRRKTSASALMLYRALRCINPSPYMLLMTFPEFSLAGSSPEVMTQVKGRRAMVRPIAGTRKRGATPEEDMRLEAELMADEKERAEHIMLVDLGRNDIGRISVPGTVAPVPGKLMVVEHYSHVMHIVSEVAGQMKPEMDAFDALEATFPMGTVSGAPKIRAMEIIDELEPERRGPYSGGCGYISFSGDMDTCILIRTAVLKDGVAYCQAGAGLVFDSNPESEYEETVNKATVLFRAVDFAEGGLQA